MYISKNYIDQKLTISIEGRIDTITSKDLESYINSELGDFESLYFDFKDVEYISSSGLRILIITYNKLNQTNTPMFIKNVNENIKEIFKMSGLDKILRIE